MHVPLVSSIKGLYNDVPIDKLSEVHPAGTERASATRICRAAVPRRVRDGQPGPAASGRLRLRLPYTHATVPGSPYTRVWSDVPYRTDVNWPLEANCTRTRHKGPDLFRWDRIANVTRRTSSTARDETYERSPSTSFMYCNAAVSAHEHQATCEPGVPPRTTTDRTRPDGTAGWAACGQISTTRSEQRGHNVLLRLAEF